MKAICQRCGVAKPGPFVPCRACGHVPVGEERPAAWLLSERHLSPAELAQASQRIRGGERPDPPATLLERAQREIAAAIPGRRRRRRSPSEERPMDLALDPDDRHATAPSPSLADLAHAAGPPAGVLTWRTIALLVLANTLLTPLLGWVTWFYWRHRSPAAARQVFWATLPITAGAATLWGLAMLTGWSPR